MHRRFRGWFNNHKSERNRIHYALRFRFNATNNEAEYEALIAGLCIARQMGVQNLQSDVDSKLRGKQKADALSKIASTSFAHLSKQVLMEELREKSIDEQEILAVEEEEEHTWMTLVHEYLTEGILPEEKKKARGLLRARKGVESDKRNITRRPLGHGCGVSDHSKQTMF
ncbi:reverse transcriptase domain-containing protein [Tanacetum coccineum]